MRGALHRLSTRMFLSFVAVALFSVSVTAWVTARGTSEAIQTGQGQTLAVDAGIHDELLGYAATHTDWSEAGSLVSELADGSGRRITLVDGGGEVLADSAGRDRPPAVRPAALVDPLSVDPFFSSDEAGGRIDPRAVGPYSLDARERERSRALAEDMVSCLRGLDVETRVETAPNGRSVVVGVESGTLHNWNCVSGGTDEIVDLKKLYAPLPTEERALVELRELVDACTGGARVSVDLAVALPSLSDFDHPYAAAAEPHPCVERSRREQLAGHTAPPAVLYLADASGEEPEGISPLEITRIAGLVAVVFVVASVVGILLSRRLSRPLRSLTDAVRRTGSEAVRVPITDRGELGELAAAFNVMSARLEESEHERRRMLADISHDLRTPLTNMRSWLEAAEDGLADPDRALTGTLLEETRQLQALIGDLEELAGFDAGTLRLRTETVAVDEVLDRVAAGHRRSAEAAGVTLLREGPTGVSLRADPRRLRRALGNLVANALSHTPGGGTITLGVAVEDGAVVLRVSDSGTGIAPEHLPLIFDRFWRADGSRNRNTGGGGLGLAIVRHITEAHGGTVAVASTVGRGSVFTLRLPGPVRPD